MLRLAAASLLASVVSASAAEPISARQTVAMFLSLADTDAARAKALLAANAPVAVLDVGGLVADLVPDAFKKLREAKCLGPILEEKGSTDSVTGVVAKVVRAQWTCSASSEDVAPSIAMRFYVAGERVIGAAIEDPPGYRFPRSLPNQ